MITNSAETFPALIITGMHRSGTSLTASLLQSSGVDIGKDLMEATGANAKGYFENLDFVHFHESILLSYGIAKEGWTLQQNIPVQGQFLQKAEQLIRQNSSKPVWGWKDPRTTLFLDFWAQKLPEAKFIFVYRSPWEVIDSLYRRGNQGDEIFIANPKLAIELWQNYNRIILDFTERNCERCLLLNLDAIGHNPEILIEKIQQKFGIALGNFAKLYDESLLTRSISWHRLALLKHHYPEALDMYDELNRKADVTLAKNDEYSAWLVSKEHSYASSDAVWAFHDWLSTRTLERELKQYRAQLHQTQAELEQHRDQLHQTQAELEQHRDQLHQTQAELEQCRAQLHQTQSELEQHRAQLHHTQGELEQHRAQLHHTQGELEQHRAQLHHTQGELEQHRDQLHHTQGELEQHRDQLHHTQGELEQYRVQLHHTQGELEQHRVQLHHTQGELEQCRLQFYQAQVELEYSYSQLQLLTWQFEQTQDRFKQAQVHLKELQVNFCEIYQEKEKLEILIRAMESSKFWKLRRVWFQVKQFVGIKQH